MTERLRAALWPSVFALFAFVILIGLGLWQVQRLGWKQGLLADIAARVTKAPVSPETAAANLAAGQDIEYVRVTTRGVFDHANERHLYQSRNGQPGWHVLTPLKRGDDPALIVNRGFVPLALKDPATRPESLVSGPVTVTGLVRMPARQGLFVPDNDVAANEWYWRDHAAMAETALGQGGNAYPFIVDAEKGGDPGDMPMDGTTRTDLPNKHFGYALTWFGLAGTLILVYVPFVIGRMREAPRERYDDSV